MKAGKKVFFIFKGFTTAVLCGAMILGSSGCGRAAESLKLKNEIVTMKAVDESKMTITIRAEYNVGNEALRSALEKKFPDVNFVSVFHCSPETQYELRQSLQGGSAEDIVISPNMKAVSDIASGSMVKVAN